VLEELIRQAAQWLGRDPSWQSIRDEAERAKQMRAAAEQAAIERVIVEQTAARDPRPVNPRLIDQEIQRRKAQAPGRGVVFDDPQVRCLAELQIRIQRTVQEMVAEAGKPAAAEIEAFYNQQRHNFRKPATFHAAHIVKHVNELQSEEQAEAGIQAALAELERGEPFAEVAERHSDCKGNGGDLRTFPAGHMVEEFEKAIDALEPGQHTGIFTTAFGFHIARLESKTPLTLASLEEVRGDIERSFTLRNQHQVYQRAIAKLRAQAQIRFVPEAQAATA
jgi:peptidyl-prolyl cis-trans isomerase C